MLAMGLMNEPALLIADEPTTALDVTIQAQIMSLLRHVTQKHGTAILLISHNLALVGQNCDRVLVMYSGTVVEDLGTENLANSALHPYTRGLLSVVPDLDRPQVGPLGFIPGEPPDPASRPLGCPYHPRCPLAMDRCQSEMPPLVTRSDGHRVACWAVEPETR
jgi:peptide/nickel transport system permease protein